MAAGSSAVVCSASVSYKKQAGVLTLYKNRQLTWTPAASSSSNQQLSLDGSLFNSLFSSKEGSAKVVLRINVLYPNAEAEQPVNFTFTSASSAISDREHFKTGLSDVIAYNKANAASADSPAPSEPVNGLSEKAKGKRKAVSPPAEDLVYDHPLRIRLLTRHPELKALHAELVLSGQITEDEFWDGREYMLQAQRQEESQVQGRSAQRVDPRPETTGENGLMKMSITPQMIADIFAQHPIVQKAYNENVPPMVDTYFWKRYFESKLFNRHRASSRQAGNIIKDDSVFDKYLVDENEDIEPEGLETQQIYRLLDLAATAEDHQETGNEKDVTMRIGNKRAAIPIMRRFNQHSERVLNTSLGGLASKENQVHDASTRNYEADILLEDLQVGNDQSRIKLNMQAQERYFASRDASDETEGANAEELESIYSTTREDFGHWRHRLHKFKFNSSLAESAASEIVQNLNARHASKAEKAYGLPEEVLQQMTSCQTSANEFLRHFWNAVLPPRPGDVSAAARASPQHKAAKAQKMIDYLRKTEDRVSLVVKSAAGHDVERIRFALNPTLSAVQHAIAYFEQRTAG